MMPCFLLSGLKCPPADVNGGSHLPVPCTWKACSPAGKPFSDNLIKTPCGSCVSSALPTSLPCASLSDALLDCACAEPAAKERASATRMMRFMNAPEHEFVCVKLGQRSLRGNATARHRRRFNALLMP